MRYFIVPPCILLWWLAATAAQASACLELDTPVITIGDLTPHVPAFRQLPASLRFGFAPDPGLLRVISAGELQRFAVSVAKAPAGSVTFDHGICILRKSRRISEEEVKAEIRRIFADRQIQVEIVELSKRAVGNTGSVRFSIHELPITTDPAQAVTWNGWFVESDGRKRPVWARVRLRETSLQAVARRDIAAGERLSAESVRLEQREGFPAAVAKLEQMEEYFDRSPRGPILAGERIRRERLVEIPAIRKGDTVTLEAISPQTRLAVEGKAASTAYRGQKVAITTTLSKKVILAVAQEQGRAIVNTSSEESGRAKGRP